MLDIEELRFSTLLLSLVLAGDVNLAAIVGACTAEDEPTARAPNLKHAARVQASTNLLRLAIFEHLKTAENGGMPSRDLRGRKYYNI